MKWFVVSSQSAPLGINLAIVIPNSELLQGLNVFQTIVTILPFLVLLILLVYLYYFRRMVIRPILNLLGGIHRIRNGAMETKLPASNLLEFQALNQAFNSMVVEIQDLKIDVYEERLNAQKAEMKHLQMQINPHFFLNTLNIIFQLADLKRYELVKKDRPSSRAVFPVYAPGEGSRSDIGAGTRSYSELSRDSKDAVSTIV
ncbi:hypothetical protein HMSSN139_50370 [Paenibacillus sp. HMSSN-139]|nr:hypothetical protein HMSSN139_50370 [Paenibacillus sp. HMSSN-139]